MEEKEENFYCEGFLCLGKRVPAKFKIIDWEGEVHARLCPRCASLARAVVGGMRIVEVE